jgi:hypothetical protein
VTRQLFFSVGMVSLCTIFCLSPVTAQEYLPRTVLRKPVRAITDPAIVSADQAEVSDDELVIGVEVNGQARAYPINQLTGPNREIINDELGGTAIAATW